MKRHTYNCSQGKAIISDCNHLPNPCNAGGPGVPTHTLTGVPSIQNNLIETTIFNDHHFSPCGWGEEYTHRFPACRTRRLKRCPDVSESTAWDNAGLLCNLQFQLKIPGCCPNTATHGETCYRLDCTIPHSQHSPQILP